MNNYGDYVVRGSQFQLAGTFNVDGKAQVASVLNYDGKTYALAWPVNPLMKVDDYGFDRASYSRSRLVVTSQFTRMKRRRRQSRTLATS